MHYFLIRKILMLYNLPQTKPGFVLKKRLIRFFSYTQKIGCQEAYSKIENPIESTGFIVTISVQL